MNDKRKKEFVYVFEPDKQNPTEVKNERWDWNYLAGIKQGFRFSKKMKGNVQMMYNVFDRYNTSPYTHRFNIRIGIEWEKGK